MWPGSLFAESAHASSHHPTQSARHSSLANRPHAAFSLRTSPSASVFGSFPPPCRAGLLFWMGFALVAVFVTPPDARFGTYDKLHFSCSLVYIKLSFLFIVCKNTVITSCRYPLILVYFPWSWIYGCLVAVPRYCKFSAGPPGGVVAGNCRSTPRKEVKLFRIEQEGAAGRCLRLLPVPGPVIGPKRSTCSRFRSSWLFFHLSPNEIIQ